MQLQVHRRLEMIRADVEGWEDSVRRHIEDGSNFVLILPSEKKAIDDFCHMFGLPSDCHPKSLNRPGFFRLSQFMEPEAFDEVLAHWQPNKQVVFVEQLDFPVNRPPRLQNFLVYSPVLGIIAQAPTMAAAKEALADYEHHWGAPLPEASIYIWQKNRWNLYEGR
jgi:hypothetical protein